MNLDEFLVLVASEPARTVRTAVWSTPPGVLAKASAAGGMRSSELLAARPAQGHREVCYMHILGPPASAETIASWQSSRPSHPLPADLRALVTHVNGIHLWANGDTGRSYTGLSPIEEWDLARIKMYGPESDPAILDDKYIVLSYHEDHSAFVVLDASTGIYYLMDTCGPDESCPIGRSVENLLDWLWRDRIAPEA